MCKGISTNQSSQTIGPAKLTPAAVNPNAVITCTLLLHSPKGAIVEHSADGFAQQFTNKLERFRASTADAPAPLITRTSHHQTVSVRATVTF